MRKPFVNRKTKMTKTMLIRVRVMPDELREIADYLESAMVESRSGEILPNVLLASIDAGETGVEVYLCHRQE